MTDKSNIIFNISGGNNQILPNATEAKQIFIGDQFADDYLHRGEQLSPEAIHLRAYINNVEHLKAYIAQLGECTTAAEVGKVVVSMAQNEPGITQETIVKQKFIGLLLPFIPKVTKGTGIANLRQSINNAWASRPRPPRP